MKFENGCWIFEEGYTCFAASEVYFVKKSETEVKITAPTTHIRGRGDTLGGVNLTFRITSPSKDIIRVQTWHHTGIQKKYPEFDLKLNKEEPIQVEEDDNYIAVTSGKLSLSIKKADFTMEYKRAGKFLTGSKGRDLACIKYMYKGMAYDREGDTANTFMRQQLSISVNEHIYGTGERFTAFVKNGQTVITENKDGGTSTDQAYKNVPFYISDKGYGVFVAHPDPVSFELASDNVTKCEFSVKGGYLDYYVIGADNMKEVLVNYTNLTGKPSLPPAWTFGLWLSTSFTTNYDEATVMSFIDGMLDRGIPLRTFHFDCFWMKEFHWTDFTWDKDVFPDPEGLLKRIKAKGLNICVWINPYVGEDADIFEEGVEKGYFIKRKNGDVWQWDMWQPGMAIVDFTNPEAYKWYQKYLEKLLDMGVDCFKTDFGERIPTEDVVYFDGSDPLRMHNYYTYIYNKCVYELLLKKRGEDGAVLFARSATAGSQCFPVHWGGDCWSDYESMEESIRGGLSLMMSGFGYWAHDIGGFEQTSTADVYKRWVAFGLLSSHSRLHGSSSYRVPWLYDDEAVDVVRFFTRLKARLMPYIYKTAIETSKTGIPTMRAMVLEYPEDRNCSYLDKQYMLGDNLLVAPIFNDKMQAEYYLPEGKWTSFFTEELYEGGKWISENCDYLSIPLMAREGAIIAVGSRDDKADYRYEDGVELRIYALGDKQTSSVTVYSKYGHEKLNAEFTRRGNQVYAKIKADKPYKIRFINMPGAELKIV